MSSSSSSSSGIGLAGLLGVAFVVLKLCHVIDWSWWWVTAPFWGGFVIFLVIFMLGLFFFALKEARAGSRR
jgi:phosphoglycerol transferase MdoB-like AlkP superfamily enzyme